MKSRLHNMVLIAIGALMGLLAPLGWSTVQSYAQGSGDCQMFHQTGHKVCGGFLLYWQQNGGLAQQGYPLSEEFTETNDLNGKPYTVQYFERAVFEKHPENQPPFDILLTQVGTLRGIDNYRGEFPGATGAQPNYEHRNDAIKALKSYYNAINRQEYDRAYRYFDAAPNPDPDLAPPLDEFAAGYASTASVALTAGKPRGGSAAGVDYAGVPTALLATHTDGSKHLYVGCYVLISDNSSVAETVYDTLWRIYSAQVSEVPLTSDIDQMLTKQCLAQ